MSSRGSAAAITRNVDRRPEVAPTGRYSPVSSARKSTACSLADALSIAYDPARARALLRRYREAFTQGYSEAHSPLTAVNDIKVIQGKEGLFISMPSRRKKNGEFKDVAHPVNQETRRWMEERILGEYHAVLEGRSQGRPTRELESGERSLEEVERLHLNDAFWGVS